MVVQEGNSRSLEIAGHRAAPRQPSCAAALAACLMAATQFRPDRKLESATHVGDLTLARPLNSSGKSRFETLCFCGWLWLLVLPVMFQGAGQSRSIIQQDLCYVYGTKLLPYINMIYPSTTLATISPNPSVNLSISPSSKQTSIS